MRAENKVEELARSGFAPSNEEILKVRARPASAGVARTPCGSLRSIGCICVSDAWARPPRAARLGFHCWIAARIGDKSALAARVQ